MLQETRIAHLPVLQREPVARDAQVVERSAGRSRVRGGRREQRAEPQRQRVVLGHRHEPAAHAAAECRVSARATRRALRQLLRARVRWRTRTRQRLAEQLVRRHTGAASCRVDGRRGVHGGHVRAARRRRRRRRPRRTRAVRASGARRGRASRHAPIGGRVVVQRDGHRVHVGRQ